MSFEQSQINNKLTRQRLPYAAVPLDPWRATHPNTGASYYATSLEKISDTTAQAIAGAIERGDIMQPDLARDLHAFVTTSLLDAHTRRIMHNGHTKTDILDEHPEDILALAKDGLATPTELFTLLSQNPQLSSIELAKLSHPFDFGASKEMEGEVAAMIKEHAEPTSDNPRYKVKRVEKTIPASIVVRKQVMGIHEAESGFIEVVERRSLLVRGDEEVREELPYANRLVKNPDRKDELASKIEAELSSSAFSGVWLQPTTTSYYARYTHIE